MSSKPGCAMVEMSDHVSCNTIIQNLSGFKIMDSELKFRLECCLKLRLHTAINWADFVSWCMLYTNEGYKMHPWENDAVKYTTYTFMDKPLKHIDQDTKWTRLIAVCKRTFTCMHFTYLHGTCYYKQVRRRRVRQVVRTVNIQINKELAKCYVCIIFQRDLRTPPEKNKSCRYHARGRFEVKTR